MDANDKPCQATPSGDLQHQIMNHNVPKNEREWWAARRIEELERENAKLQERVLTKDDKAAIAAIVRETRG